MSTWRKLRVSPILHYYKLLYLNEFQVLIMVPFKDAAYRIVKTLIDIVVPKEAGQVVNKNRFEEDFTGGALIMPSKNPKPEDYELLFSGNTDDTFRLGMTLTKKTLKVSRNFSFQIEFGLENQSKSNQRIPVILKT